MQNFFEFIFSFLNHEKFLLFTEIFLLFAELISLSLKLFFLIIVIKHSIRASLPKRLLLLLIGVLMGSMIHTDASWIPLHLKNIFFSNLDFRISGFMGRIGWVFFLIQNQSLTLLLENLIAKNFKLKKKHITLLTITSTLLICELYLAFFEFNRPQLVGLPLELEKKLIQCECLHLFILFIPTLYATIKKIRSTNLPKILSHQLKTFLLFLVLPHLFLDLLTNKLFFFPIFVSLSPLSRYSILSISTILISYALYYCCKRMIGLRFLNLKTHVESREKFNFINDFKDILEQLSYVTSLKELSHISQIFFNAAFTIPVGQTRLYIRKIEDEIQNNSIHHDITSIYNKVEYFLIKNINTTGSIGRLLKETKIFIKDELEFSNFYEEKSYRTEIIKFLENINADVFLPIYERQSITAYIVIERNARADQLYTSSERDEMIVFASYLSNIINILKHSNLEALLRKEKELEEELYKKHQEINQYKESIRSFLRTNKERKIGIVFFKGRKFTYANQAAKELISIDINSNQGHQLARAFKNVAQRVQEYKSSQTTFSKDFNGNKLMLAAVPSLEQNTVIILIYYPEATDIIKSQIELLKDPSHWDYLLYLETTKSGQLISQLIPGTGETLLNFKISLLSTALSRKATLLEMAEDDIIPTVELLHHISLRQNLYTIKLSNPEKNNEIAIKLFGINPLLESSEQTEPLLEKLNNIGTVFIQNIQFLSIETQQYLAEFITYGFFHRFKSDNKIFSNVRIICSSSKNLQNLVHEGQFSKTLFQELKKTTLKFPSLSTLSGQEITNLAHGFNEQAFKSHTFKNLLTLNEKDTHKLIHKKPVSLQELKEQVQQLLVAKSNKHNISENIEFDPAYYINTPDIAKAVQLGKNALRDPKIMELLWDTFKNQNKIATLLGVNRSSVNRRLQKYNLK